MDESEHFNIVVEGAAETSSKKRPRKKHLYNQILQQMEFYFSDANLVRDRFLSQMLQQNKNVPLDVFLRFNRIRALTMNTDDIIKALGSSELLKITEDGKCVYRTRAVQKKENQDDCVIYVEQLPPDANHDWVIGIFSAYGKVDYVSIPKYKNRAAIKGFAFVEFDTPEAAKKALEAFGSVGCCLPPQMPPEELCSIVTFEEDDAGNETTLHEECEVAKKQKSKKVRQHTLKNTEENDDTYEQVENLGPKEMDSETKTKKVAINIDEHGAGEKRKKKKNLEYDGEAHEMEDCIEDNEAADSTKTKKSKKRKLENDNLETSDVTVSCDLKDHDDGSQIKKKKKRMEGEQTTNDATDHLKNEEGLGGSEMQTSIVKNKKRRKQDIEDEMEDMKNVIEEMEVKEEDNDSHIIKKKKKKKSEECEGERDADSDFEDAEDEGTTKRTKQQSDEEEENDEADGDAGKSEKKKRSRRRNKNKKKGVEKKENDPTSLGLRIISKNEWRRLRNKYLNLQREKMQGLKKQLVRAKFGNNYQSPFPSGENGRQEVKQEQKPQAEKTEYISGVIVHVEFADPLSDVKSFKTNAKLHQGVKYVDANEGDSEAYIRCSSAEVAQKLLAEQTWDNMKVLKGKAENAYWEKIQQDRQSKIKNKIRVNARGREKLLKRAERELGKHIKFDD